MTDELSFSKNQGRRPSRDETRPAGDTRLEDGSQPSREAGEIAWALPGQATTLPGQTTTLPGQTTTLPGQTNTLPEQPTTQPEHPADQPNCHSASQAPSETRPPALSDSSTTPASSETGLPLVPPSAPPPEQITQPDPQAVPASLNRKIESASPLDNWIEESKEEETEKDDDGFAFPSFGDDDEEPVKTAGLDLGRFIRGITSRKLIVATVATVILSLFATLAFTTMHHSWISRVTLIKRAHQDQFQVGRFGVPFKAQKYNMKTLLDTLLLPSSIDETLRRSGIDVEHKDFIKQIELHEGKESVIFGLTVEWDDADTATRLVNNLADVFIERNRQIRRGDAEETLLYYQDQLDQAKRKADAINAELQSFQEEFAIADIGTQLQVLVTEKSNKEIELRELSAEATATEENVTRIRKALEDEPEMIVQSSYYRNPLQKNLSDLEWALEQARGRYTDENPKVIDLQARINKIKGLITAGKDADTQSNTYAANPVRGELSVKRYAMEEKLSDQRSRLKGLTELNQSLTERLDLLTAKQKEYDQLKARQASSLQLQGNLRNRVEEARVIMQRNEADFEILERARNPLEPESSGRKAMVILGTILGGILGIVVALILELSDKRARTRRDALDISANSKGVAELLGEFQHVPGSDQIVVDTHYPNEPVAKLFRRFINDMEATLEEEDRRIFAMVSEEHHAGRSLLATNLAQAMGLKENKVILVDADLSHEAGERPNKLYEIDPKASGQPGLIQILEEGLDPLMHLTDTETPGVRILPASNLDHVPESAIMLLGGRRFRALVNRLKMTDGYVIIDLPPMSAHEICFEAAACVGKAMLVIRSGQTLRPDAKAMVQRLDALGVDIPFAFASDVPFDLTENQPLFEPEARKPKDKKGQKPADGQNSNAQDGKPGLITRITSGITGRLRRKSKSTDGKDDSDKGSTSQASA